MDLLHGATGTAPLAGALLAINMLVGTPEGSTFSESQYKQWLTKAGFNRVERVNLPGPNDLLIAHCSLLIALRA